MALINTIKKGIHGKPYLEGNADIKINLSHCNELAVCAVGKGTAIGIDCEALRTVRERVIKRVCTVQEQYEIDNRLSDCGLMIYDNSKQGSGRLRKAL